MNCSCIIEILEDHVKNLESHKSKRKLSGLPFKGGRWLGVWFVCKGTVKEKRLIRRFLEYSKQETTD